MKNNLLIAVQGFHDSGKTTVLKKLCNLIANDKQVKEFKTIPKEIWEQETLRKTDWEPINEFSIPKSGDVVLIFKFNDLLLGVATGGDNKTEVEKRLEYFKAQRCDIIITATRTSGDTVKSVYGYISANTDFIPLFKAKECADFDDKLVNEIFNIIKLKTGE